MDSEDETGLRGIDRYRRGSGATGGGLYIVDFEEPQLPFHGHKRKGAGFLQQVAKLPHVPGRRTLPAMLASRRDAAGYFGLTEDAPKMEFFAAGHGDIWKGVAYPVVASEIKRLAGVNEKRAANVRVPGAILDVLEPVGDQPCPRLPNR